MGCSLGAAVLAAALVLSGCGGGSHPARAKTAATAPVPVRTLYVQAPLSGPAAAEGRAMVDAVRLVVDQSGGVAGAVRVIVRALDDGGAGAATDPARCAANARRAVADPATLAVIGTYELSCSERALGVLRPAGIMLVSPVNAAGDLPGALRLAPTLGDEGTAVAQLAHALGATRIAIVSQRRGAGIAFARGLAAAAPALGAGPVAQLDAATTPTAGLVPRLEAAQVQLVALAGSPGPWASDLLRAVARMPVAMRPSLVASQSFETLTFLDSAGTAAQGMRVISRLVPAEQLGGSARSFADAYAELHGEPPPVAVYAADAAQTVLQAAAVSGATRAKVSTALAALPAHDALLGRWAATPTGGITPRPLAVLIIDNGTFRVERVVSVSDPVAAPG
ncbi:MAG: branched-chain amino acid transport system substrate-binding protein [Gaiellales bacterium]|nr:branched-chain amino acid transport system substrate-binding protein [Gaiellales bacterium]